MLVLCEESGKEIFLDIYLTDQDIETLREGQMISEDSRNWISGGKQLYIGLLKPPYEG